ncbi:multidrug ABC transporter ATP-binding protein [Ureibacillus massiliensis 4400831 = CIP 108448 = CCUG 49529]|uniref:Multidrug ABC transporter ATP-binding protein n=1 Tax=Ureibacillus massiliensis 4400831 = CIP 108448 = CCUG 49529 TaxID=1211035 RepID=A0A0A3J511_9BACL|nr:ABC transporter ATP-binding protein [Ureibacillus massiliensis]KGR92021.1 multidrug ABC transporter ATP-binding protein [Ureibacillus massiliensis 4400831 = CIP 108448 = CCUG 49529]
MPRSPLKHPGGRFNGPAEKAKNQKATIRRIWTYLKNERIGLISAIVFVILSSILSILGPLIIGIIIDQYILPKDIAGAIRMIVLLAAIYVVGAMLTWLQTFVMIHVSQKSIWQLRQHLFKKFQALPLSSFDKRQQGDLMSRMTNDIENLNAALSQSVLQIISTVLTVIGTAIAMLYLNWILAIVTMLIIPCILWSAKQIIKRSSKNYAERQKDLGNLNGFIAESISNSDITTLFGKEAQTIEQFHEANEKLRSSAMRAEIVSGLMGPMNNFINTLGLGIVVGVGALMSINNLVTIGIIASFVTYSRQFLRPINQLSNLFNTFQSAIAGAERVFEIMDEDEEVKDIPNAITKDKFIGEVIFRNVHFSYNDEKPVLNNISFHAKAGDTVALVGPTGSGKTTIIQLLNRFYDVTSGEILIDGENIKHYKMENIREHIGVVLQDTYLFSGTVRENIRYGKLDATDEEVKQAAKIAFAHSFIKYLPQQYDTMLVSGGMNLSQGQRQLIAIARAILEDSDILILDEATSSVDTMTEVHIQKGLNNLMKGRTSFVIAHRLKTIENADQILVIKDGSIIEQGNHQILMNQRGFYANLQNQLQVQ